MPKVSVIMPVYQAEKYLAQAIESVLKQTYPDFELLLINDRSTDRSREICAEYSTKDSRILLLDNASRAHGPGPTRNIGLDQARGEYIYFMDADDWIENNLLERAVHHIQQTNADIVQFGVIDERDGNDHCLQYCWHGKAVLTKEEIQQDFRSFWKESRKSLWLHLFRRETVGSIRFAHILTGEDVSYVMDCLGRAEKLSFLPEPLYHYRYVEGSTSHQWHEDVIGCRLVIWNHLRALLDSFPGGLDELAYAEAAYEQYLWAIYLLCSHRCTLSWREKKRELRSVRDAIDLDKYRKQYPLAQQHGVQKMKYLLVKYGLESILLMLGPIFLRVVRGE